MYNQISSSGSCELRVKCCAIRTETSNQDPLDSICSVDIITYADLQQQQRVIGSNEQQHFHSKEQLIWFFLHPQGQMDLGQGQVCKPRLQADEMCLSAC